MWVHLALHLGLVVAIIYLLARVNDMTFERRCLLVAREQLLEDMKSLTGENQGLRAALVLLEGQVKDKNEEVVRKNEEVFQYSSMAANLRSRVRKLGEDLEEAVK